MENVRILLQAPALSLQLVADGILIGGIFALSAYGMALVWGVMGLINVSQGELVMLGGYAAYPPSITSSPWLTLISPITPQTRAIP